MSNTYRLCNFLYTHCDLLCEIHMTNNNLPLHYKPSFPSAQYWTEEATCLKVFASILNVKMLKKRVNLGRELLRSGYLRFTLMYSKWCVKWWFPTQPVAESLFGMTFVVAPVATTKMNLYIHLEHLPCRGVKEKFCMTKWQQIFCKHLQTKFVLQNSNEKVV